MNPQELIDYITKELEKIEIYDREKEDFYILTSDVYKALDRISKEIEDS